VLPFLYNERLQARVDLKADRGHGTVQVLAAYGEQKVKDSGDIRIAQALATVLRRLADWLNLPQIQIIRRGDLAEPLKQALSTAAGG
jgi:uncharacterized protein YcaQ